MEHIVKLQYHQKTFNLLMKQPIISADSVAALERFEQVEKISLPASVREWYCCGGRDLLDIGSDRAIDFRTLPVNNKYHHLLEQGLLPILIENQAVVKWAVRLDGSADPAVLVTWDEIRPSAVWELYAETFSVFAFTRLWDDSGIRSDTALRAFKTLLPSELVFL